MVPKLQSISELVGKNFFIPSYQRGYRWDKQQVEDLLNDIYAFATKKKAENEFYCLQPIVVRKCSDNEIRDNGLNSELDENKWYEVIDGQQRLTTLRILISYFAKELYKSSFYDEHGKYPFKIEYETRKGSSDFLDNIVYSNETIDFYYISEAFEAIQSWFEKSRIEDWDPRQGKEIIRNTLVYKTNVQGIVQIIWYEIEENVNPIDTFIRINLGKIPLTSAELIKALFLQKRNFESDSAAEIRQIEISNEWDKMEYALQNEEFWWFLNEKQNDISARIEFLFDLICGIQKEKDPKFDEKYGTDKYVTFRYFNEKFPSDINIKNIEKEWDDIKSYFSAFEEWFSNPVWYHYIGFLISCGENLVNIYKIYIGKKKDEFGAALRLKIKEQFSKINCQKTGEEYQIDLLYGNDKTKQLLLLFNIVFIVKQYEKLKDKNLQEKDQDVFIVKFPFKIFKTEKWDAEHIASYTPNSITELDDQKEWLETAMDDLEKEIGRPFDEDIEALYKNIEAYLALENADVAKFEDLYKEISSIVGDDELDEDAKNSIGNLTLLNSDINRSYGNKLFRTKRRIIIEKDMEGKFIPICTKHVFLKYFDTKGTSRTKWQKKDIDNYQNFMGKELDEFLTFKTEVQS